MATKEVLTSRTTQNVLAGGAGTGGAVLAVLVALRGVAPDLLPWGVEVDAAIATVIMMVIVPLASRAIALWRNPEKADTKPVDELLANDSGPEM